MTLLKITLFGQFGVMQCLYGLRLKNITIFSTYCTLLLLLYSLLRLSEMHRFYKAHRSENETCTDLDRYPVHCDWPNTSSVRRKCYAPLPYCDAVSRRNKTKTIKPIVNEAFVASSGDKVTDYNDLYCLFTCRFASRRVKITTTAFVIGEMTNNKHSSTRLKTHVLIVSSRNILTGCESEACKVGIAAVYRNSLYAQLAL